MGRRSFWRTTKGRCDIIAPPDCSMRLRHRQLFARLRGVTGTRSSGIAHLYPRTSDRCRSDLYGRLEAVRRDFHPQCSELGGSATQQVRGLWTSLPPRSRIHRNICRCVGNVGPAKGWRTTRQDCSNADLTRARTGRQRQKCFQEERSGDGYAPRRVLRLRARRRRRRQTIPNRPSGRHRRPRRGDGLR